MKIGAGLALDGEKEFKKAISGINKDLYVLGSEMGKVTAQFSKNASSMDGLKAKSEVYNKQIEEQKKKIDALKQALENSAKEFGENSNKTKDWQIKLNRAETDLAKTENSLKDTTKQMDNFGEESDDTAVSLDKAGKSANDNKGRFAALGGALKVSAAAMGAIAVAAGAAAVKLGKAVLSEFADYEQLVGGVDTLFKDSSGKLQEYAANAYKTAGLSGNEYMETVTSFSASLIQSLGGDTEKAVKYADMAITDMSDNANKMGTDMGSIQNAYQGFAKQNYTMLDNLKLGYGGTKTEMERLLTDATAISGIKYDVSSYSDVVSAIHIIQDNMGITGTTALEAEDTITGSLDSVKSAWENMISGLGNSDADMGKLSENLAEAFGNVVKNVVPIIQSITSALPDAISAILPEIGKLLPNLINTATTLFQEVLSALLKLLPELIPVVVNAIITIVDTIVENLPLIIDGALKLIMALAQGLIEYLPKLIPSVVKIILEMVNTLLDNLPTLIDCAIDLILALVDGILEALPMMLEQGPVIIKKLIDGIVGAIPKLVDAAIDIILGIVEYMINNLDTMIKASLEIIFAIAGGLIKAIPELLKAIPKLFIALVKGFMEMDWLQIGEDILSGIGKGLIDGVKNIGGAIKDAASGVVSGFKNFFGINSPSRLFKEEIGLNLADGIGEGFTDEMKKVTDDMVNSVPTDFETDVNVNQRVSGRPKSGFSLGNIIVNIDKINTNDPTSVKAVAQAIGFEVKMQVAGGIA